MSKFITDFEKEFSKGTMVYVITKENVKIVMCNLYMCRRIFIRVDEGISVYKYDMVTSQGVVLLANW